MNLLFTVQRYGREVAGGAERHCREFATRLGARGHQVEVLTSCARDYVDWANHYPEGDEERDGVLVHRLPVATPRDDEAFSRLNHEVLTAAYPRPEQQRRWMEAQGPDLPDLVPWLEDNAPRFDAAVFFTYLYRTTYDGLPAARCHAPTVLHATAHDEPAFRLPIFDLVLRFPDAYAFSTEEEAKLIERRLGREAPGQVIGVGVTTTPTPDVAGFRERFSLGERPYLVSVGRVEPAKGSHELVEHFGAYKERHPGPLALVVVGETVRELRDHPDIVVTGYLDDAQKDAALAGAVLQVVPSPFESFSMVLAEGWAYGVPALVQGAADVLVGQVERAGGGIPYQGDASFEEALALLLADQGLRRRLGTAGRRYVEDHYGWDDVLDRYEELLDSIT